MSPALLFSGLKAVAYAGLALAHADPLVCFGCCYSIAWLTLGEGIYQAHCEPRVQEDLPLYE